ncbi:leucyl/phenylalanyl-tRNA--protein transferase [Sulfurimonas sp. SAG-AH-194-C21]|nr:leucyl/phenylalanyl-tRNA--protein transferase [Sulfurimonas sp. SAG-AH-194-C21]MDF1884472.1 leucyl/phenylalanyl-tRNA--protein transferase [Sulfurimonas sp. SAG-AH-194-C21]
MQIPKLYEDSFEFPDPNSANEDGIVAWGGDLDPSRLINAYQLGIFPWNSKNDPLLWWSPNPRLIMELYNFKVSKSLKKSMKKFTYKFDTNFTEVLNQCSSTPRNNQDGTWLHNALKQSFEILHYEGIAHSVESYLDGALVGGLYGIVVGKVFCGESMFSHVSDASKSAYAVLIKHLKEWGYDFVDCQVPTAHLQSLGAHEVHREYFLMRLNNVNMQTIEHKWEVDSSIL